MREATEKNPEFVYRFLPAPKPEEAATLLLLHGTGGNENDLIPLGQALLPETLPDLDGRGIFLGAGRNDPIVPIANTEALAALFEQAGAQVMPYWHGDGHSLIQEEVQAAQVWLQRRLD